ncbi:MULTISPECIES: HK97 family phage prohead protease [unclassified Caballeronia]|uniref:HK97 family phage prohead protease n=1 Tax=unclassified Caballeronia TaxID=2646786 RepID=UPI001F3A8660|nr:MULTISPECIES: HK97 family phage prohead protease [unclassified Caballeronia]MCE4541389.1 HK97 family phage prohead protease [Caballeronia sp. PC1]MCE4569567.1 HK97 family phage prohead protease [Caballeronia sp. CLC5]
MRVLKGYATTSDVDVVGDIVKPGGVIFNKMPLPLLGGHDHKLPIGTVVSAKADAKGVMITAHLIPKGESRTADDWAAAAKFGAAQAFSIGFRSAGATPNQHGGKTYDTSLVHEVSLVVVPANSACVAKYSETPDAAPAAPAKVKPQAAKPSPKATETTKRYSLLPFLAD